MAFDFYLLLFLYYISHFQMLSMINRPRKLEKRSVIFAILRMSRSFGKMGCQYGRYIFNICVQTIILNILFSRNC